MKRRSIGIAVLSVASIAAMWLFASHLSLATIGRQEQIVRDQIAEHPIVSWVLGFFVYLVVSLVPGTRGKAVVSGWLFGFWPGLVLVNGALTLAALIGFVLGRYLLREAVTDRYAVKLAHINRALEANGAFYVILLRLVPVSFTLTNYLLGATRLNSKTYWWATQLGLLPGNLVFVLAGARLPSLQEFAEQGWSTLFSWDVIGSMILLSGFAMLVPLLVNRWMNRAKAKL